MLLGQSSFDNVAHIRESDFEDSKVPEGERSVFHIGDQLNNSEFRSFLSGKEEDVNDEYN